VEAGKRESGRLKVPLGVSYYYHTLWLRLVENCSNPFQAGLFIAQTLQGWRCRSPTR
jgi:hypothetical protein